MSDTKKKPTVGTRLNAGKPRWRNFPMFLMEPVIRVGSFAEKREGNPNGKYETFNYLKGMYVNDCMDSLKRHLMKFESPYHPDVDEETMESHLAHVAWNALVALHMLQTRPELDDRYKLEQPKEEIKVVDESYLAELGEKVRPESKKLSVGDTVRIRKWDEITDKDRPLLYRWEPGENKVGIIYNSYNVGGLVLFGVRGEDGEVINSSYHDFELEKIESVITDGEGG